MNTEIKKEAAVYLSVQEARVMPINLLKEAEEKVFLRACLRKTGRPGFIILLIRVKSKAENSAIYSAGSEQKEKNIKTACRLNKILTGREEE